VLLVRFLLVFMLVLAVDALAGEPRNPATEMQTGKNSRLAQEALVKINESKGAEMVLRLEEAVRLDPDSPLLHHLLAIALHSKAWEKKVKTEASSRLLMRALEEEEAAVRLFPDYRDAWYLLSLWTEELGKHERAAEALSQLIRLQPSDFSHHSKRIYLWSRAGNYGAAVQAGREWVAAQPDDEDAHLRLADALTKLGKLEEALAEYRRSQELKPEEWLHLRIGAVLALQGRWQEADAAFALGEQGIEYPLAWYGRAVTQVKMGNMKEARRLLTMLKEDEQDNLVKRLQALLKDPKSEAVMGFDAYEDP
jgi:tetratricopeptide (TPR) repeat protein